VGLKTSPSATPGTAWPTISDGPPFYYWTVQPDTDIPAGTYAVVELGSFHLGVRVRFEWSRNRLGIWLLESGDAHTTDGGRGDSGTAVDAGGAVSGTFTLTTTTPDSNNTAVGSYPSQKDGPGFGYEVISCSPA